MRKDLIILCHSLPFQQPLYSSMSFEKAWGNITSILIYSIRDAIALYQEIHSSFYLSSQSWSRSLVSSFNAHSSFGPRWAASRAILRQLLAWLTLSPSSTEQHYWARFAFGWELPKGLEEQISSRCPSSLSPFLHLIHPLFWEGVFYFSGKVWFIILWVSLG